MSKVSSILGFGLFLVLAISGCIPFNYQVRYYVHSEAKGLMVKPDPIVIEQDSVKGMIQFEPGKKRLKKNQLLELTLILESHGADQVLETYTLSATDLKKPFELELAQPLNIALKEGRGYIIVRGKKRKRNGLEKSMMGHMLCEVYTDSAKAIAIRTQKH